MENKIKTLILPNKGNIYTLNEIEKIYIKNEIFSTSFLFKKNIKFNKNEVPMKIKDIKTIYIKF